MEGCGVSKGKRTGASLSPTCGAQASAGEFFGGVGPDFAQSGVIVGDFAQFGGGRAVTQGDDDFVDEFGGMGSDHGPAEEFTGFAVGEQFDEAVGFAADDGFAVVVEGIGRGGEVDPEFGRFAFAQANHGGLGFGEDGEEAQAVVDGFEGFVFTAQEPRRIAGGNFALLDGDVDNFQFPGDVARAENMRDQGLLRVAGAKRPALELI